MPIRINLLNEVLAEEDLRRRDPVKRSIFIGVFLVVLSLVWFSSSWLEYKLTQQKFSQVEIEIQSHTNEYVVVQADLKKISESQRRLDALNKLSTNRFLQGNLLNALQQIYVPNVQLVRLRLDQAYESKAGTPDKTNSFGVVAGRPGISVERITLTLDAKDAGATPGDQVNHFTETLARQDFFKSSLDTTNGIKLSNLSSVQSNLGNKPYVPFTLECRFPDKNR